jgi:hypothetical protein
LICDAPLAAAPIIDAVTRLNVDEGERLGLIARGRAAGVTDAMPQIMQWLDALAAGMPR